MSVSLPKKFLLKGEVRKRMVSDGVLQQEKLTQTFLMPNGRQLLTATFVLDDDGKAPMVIIGDVDIVPLGMADVLGAVRVFRFTESLSRIDTQAGVLCATAPYMDRLKPDDDLVVSMKKQIAELIEPKTLDRVLKEVPADLVDMMVRVRNEFGIPLYTDTVTDAVEAGQLEYTAVLEQLRVEHPNKRRARIEHCKAVRERVRPHLLAFFKRNGDDESELPFFERAAIITAARKLTDDTEKLVGVSILAAYALRQHASSLFSFIPPAMADFYGARRNDFAIGIVADFLALQFQGTTSPSTIKQELKNLLVKWDDTEPDETLC